MATKTVKDTAKKKRQVSPERAIRLKCLECCCGQAIEVEQCGLTGCPLYDFRMYGVQPKEPNPEVKTPDEIIEPISKVDTGTGTICGEEPVIAETVKPIEVEITKENIVMTTEEAEKHTLVVEQEKKQPVDDDFDLEFDDTETVIEDLDEKPAVKKPASANKTANKDEALLESITDGMEDSSVIDSVHDEPVKTTDGEQLSIDDLDVEDVEVSDKPVIDTSPIQGDKFVIDLKKVMRDPDKPEKKQRKKPVKKEKPVEEQKPVVEETDDSLDDIDVDELFDDFGI